MTLNNTVTLKSGLEVTQCHFKLVPFESLDAVSYSPSIVTVAVSITVMKYSASKYSVTLKTGLGVVQGHRKWRRPIDHIRLSIGLPL